MSLKKKKFNKTPPKPHYNNNKKTPPKQTKNPQTNSQAKKKETPQNPNKQGKRQKSRGILNSWWGRQHSPLTLMKFSWLALYEYLAFPPHNHDLIISEIPVQFLLSSLAFLPRWLLALLLVFQILPISPSVLVPSWPKTEISKNPSSTLPLQHLLAQGNRTQKHNVKCSKYRFWLYPQIFHGRWWTNRSLAKEEGRINLQWAQIWNSWKLT